MHTARSALTLATMALLLAACGGGDTDAGPGLDSASASSQRAFVMKGGTGGGTLPSSSATSPLPTSAPAPDILVRESFGPGPDTLRPSGGKGVLKPTYLHTTIGGFWVEWPGNKNSAWITPDGDQTWKFCGIGGYLDPYELPSPLQPDLSTQGCVSSEWFDTVTQYPTALLPFSAPATPYAVSMEGWPSVVPGAYVAIGLTSSGATLSNFSTVGQVWMSLRKQEAMVNGPLVYEVRTQGVSGELLASGVIDDLTWNQMMLRYDPVAKQLTASLNGQVLGTYPLDMPAPRYAGFEGVGILDNFVIRNAP